MVKNLKTKHTKCWPGYGVTTALTHCWWNLENSLTVSYKDIHTYLSHDPAIPLLGI